MLQARDRLPTLMQEISSLGCKVTTKLEMGGTLSIESKEPQMQSSASDGEATNEKKIEDYPRPLAVVGASVL